MRAIIGITVVLLIAVLSLAYLYFSNLHQDSRTNDRVLTEIPSDAAMVLQFRNEKSMYDIFRNYTMFDALTGKRRAAELSWLKEKLINHPELYEASEDQNMFLSVHPNPGDSVSLLWLIPLQTKLTIEDCVTLIKEMDSVEVSVDSAKNLSFIQVNAPALSRHFFLSVDGGVLKGSFSKDLLVRSMEPASLKIDGAFVKHIKDGLKADENALANVYIKHQRNPGFLKPFFKDNLSGNFALFNSFTASASLRMNYKSDALMFNGVTLAEGPADNYIKLFLHQDPVKNTIKRIYPVNTSNAIAYGLSNVQAFHDDLKDLLSKRKELAGLQEKLELIRSETGVNADRDIKKLFQNEFTTFQLSSWETIGVIKLSNGSQMDFFLEPLSSTYSESVRKINYSDLLYYYFGDPFKKYSQPFYAITDNLLIVSNSPNSVQRFLNDLNAGKVLYNSEPFMHFDQLVADQSNISFMLHFGNSGSLLRNILKRPYSRTLTDSNYGIKNLYGISYQLISNSDHFFTNFYSGYKAGTIKTDSIVYSTDTTLN